MMVFTPKLYQMPKEHVLMQALIEVSLITTIKTI
jgi:hypothetical protein